MKRRIPILGSILVLSLLISNPADAPAQMRHGGMMGQDSTRMGHMMPELMSMCMRMQGMGMMGPGMMGPGMMGHGMMHAGAVAPGFLLGLKDELGLTDDQVARLEAIHEELRQRAEAQSAKLREAHQSVGETRRQQDWDALRRAIDEAAMARAEQAKAAVDAAERSLAVLNDAQRDRLRGWHQGHLLFERQMQEMMKERMRGMMHGPMHQMDTEGHP